MPRQDLKFFYSPFHQPRALYQQNHKACSKQFRPSAQPLLKKQGASDNAMSKQNICKPSDLFRAPKEFAFAQNFLRTSPFCLQKPTAEKLHAASISQMAFQLPPLPAQFRLCDGYSRGQFLRSEYQNSS